MKKYTPLFESFLNTIAYYYPKNMYATDSLFLETNETKAYKNLSSKWNNGIFQDQLDLFTTALKNNYTKNVVKVNQLVTYISC